MTQKANTDSAPASAEFKNLVELLGIYTDASNRLDELQNDANKELLEALDERKADYAKLQATLTETEEALRAVALAHPEWFAEKKSLATPYGTVKLHASSWLEPKDEEVSILLIKRACDEEDARSQAAQEPAAFTINTFLRFKETLDLEALSKLDDGLLKRFRIERKHDDNFKVEPAKVKMGKAMKDAGKTKAA